MSNVGPSIYVNTGNESVDLYMKQFLIDFGCSIVDSHNQCDRLIVSDDTNQVLPEDQRILYINGNHHIRILRAKIWGVNDQPEVTSLQLAKIVSSMIDSKMGWGWTGEKNVSEFNFPSLERQILEQKRYTMSSEKIAPIDWLFSKAKIHPSVVIVASSKEVLSRPRDLSKFDIIIKFNETPLEEYRDYISDRIDIWCIRSGLVYDPVKVKRAKEIWVMNTEKLYNSNNRYRKKDPWTTIKDKRFLRHKEKIRFIDHGRLNRFAKENGYTMGMGTFPRPSTGLAGLIEALSRYPPPIYLIGFDHITDIYTGSKGLSGKYPIDTPDKTFTYNTHHNFVKERRFVSAMLKQGIFKSVT